MNGLSAYSDDDDARHSDSETPKHPSNDKDKPSKGTPSRFTDARKLVIRRPPANRPTTIRRAHLSGEVLAEDSGSSSVSKSESIPPSSETPPLPSSSRSNSEGLATIRALLKPPPIPDVEDWGIPAPCTSSPDPALQTKLAQFSALKHHPTDPKHFNDSLMSNRSFRNPHLYAKLVEFVDVDEKVTNFPKDIWDPFDVRPEWFADKLADEQKTLAEKQAAAQTAGKRTRIDFVPAKHKDPPMATGAAPPLKKSRYGSSSASNSNSGYGYAGGARHGVGPHTRRS